MVLSSQQALHLINEALDDMKAENVVALNVKNMTSVADYMVIANGTSSQHLKSLVNHVRDKAKQQGVEILGVEGEQFSEWILLDLGNVIVHAMLPEIRQYYALEKLWSVEPIAAIA